MYDVVILTDKRYEDPKSIDWYIQQVLTEDQLLILELEKFGLRVIKKAWNSSIFNWSIIFFRNLRDGTREPFLPLSIPIVPPVYKI